MSLSIQASDPLVKTNRSGLITAIIPNAYTHESRLMGGFYSATINLAANEDNTNDWIQNGINRHIEVYNPALELVWAGFVNQIDIDYGENVYSIGPLVEIGNKIAVTYSTVDTTVDPPIIGARATTAYADNNTSQAKYGVWEKLRSLSGATSTEAEQVRDTYASNPATAFPYVGNKINTEASNLNISLKCLGYWHYLTAYYYTNSATGTVNLDQKIQDVLAASPNAVFSTDYSKITANTTQVPDALAQEQYAETVLLRLNDYGDSSFNPYAIGFYENQVLRYEVIPTTIEYQKRRGKPVTDRLGGLVHPWNVRPAKWLFQPDMLIGRYPPTTTENLGTDPRALLIETVKYIAPYTTNISGTRYSQIDQILARNGLSV